VTAGLSLLHNPEFRLCLCFLPKPASFPTILSVFFLPPRIRFPGEGRAHLCMWSLLPSRFFPRRHSPLNFPFPWFFCQNCPRRSAAFSIPLPGDRPFSFSPLRYIFGFPRVAVNVSLSPPDLVRYTRTLFGVCYGTN